ncbi:MAG TPA: peptidylprolyl isomerase [Balneolaceae bacterium]|nr:peptidylprolyl isomerase [Balneolaceae bacterium]
MNDFRFTAFATILFLLPILGLRAQNTTGSQPQPVDQIVAVVDSHVILKSDVDQRVKQELYQLRQQKNQNVSFKKSMWYSALQSMVQNYVLLDQAKIDSVTVTDDQVNQRVNQTIQQYINQVGSKSALQKQMGKTMAEIRSSMRNNYRRQMIIQKYRQKKMQNVQITRPEVKAYFNSIPKDSLPTVPEKVALSQIVAVAPPKKHAIAKARHLAEQIRDSIVNDGKSFEAMAKKYSDGPSAKNGGEIPMYPINQLTPNYAAAASALKPGEVSKVVRTPFGFHIIRLNKRRGNKIDTNNILIAISKNSYNKQAAINKLNQLRDSILNNDNVTFAQIARKESDDPNTAPRGGRILNPQNGNRLLTFDQLDPSLYRIVLLLKNVGDISKPKPFTLGKGNDNITNKQAYRIVRLDKDIPEHTANLKQDYSAIKNRALQQKQYKVMQKWLNRLKKQVFIDYKIPLPKKYSKLAQNGR